MKQTTILLALLFFMTCGLYGQQAQESPEAYISRVSRLPGAEVLPGWAVKTNLLYDLSTTFSLGFEARLSNSLTLEVSAGYNPWTFSGNKKLKHVLVQPELRYWINEPFNGHFLGAHLLYTNFNAGGLNLPLDIFPGLKDSRYRGDGYGGGLSYGYGWILSPRWSMEASFGFGYLYLDYTRYECKTCGRSLGHENKHYFGPTKLAVSLIYIIK